MCMLVPPTPSFAYHKLIVCVCLAATFSAASYTVINVGEETRPRLISCVKASQGFDWNQGKLPLLYIVVWDGGS
jgi:hypothetical protein